MPAELESGFFGSTATGDRWAAWHGLGTVIDRPVVDTAEAIVLAGLDWTIEAVPLRVLMAGGAIAKNDALHAQIRTDTRKVLGVTSSEYQPVQNTERFAFMDELLRTEQASIHTAGSLKGGRQVWILAELPAEVKIAGVDTETIKMYLLLSDGTEGSSSMKVAVTPVRVVCTNTCRYALRTTPRLWTARHTSGMQARMQEAATTLQLTHAYVAALEAQADELVRAKMAPSEFRAFLDALMPLPEHTPETDRSWVNIAERRDAIHAVYTEADNLANVRGTRWAALQAVGEWQDWYRGASAGGSEERRRAREEAAWLRRVGTAASVKDAAFDLLTA